MIKSFILFVEIVFLKPSKIFVSELLLLSDDNHLSHEADDVLLLGVWVICSFTWDIDIAAYFIFIVMPLIDDFFALGLRTEVVTKTFIIFLI